MFSAKTRSESLNTIEDQVFDLVIIGGGITGAGIARDAASRGMSVALFEASDFAIGTSSRSSKLIHGGVRYLENLEFGLVFEALAERALLFKIAPHLVHPLRFMIPIYKNSRVKYWQMLLGMWLYDILALFETPQMHEGLGVRQVVERIPDINARELVGAVEYSDAYTDDDRLVIETLRDARRMGAEVVNYARVESAEIKDDQVQSILVKDQKTGATKQVRGRQFVSSVGPWTDILGQSFFNHWKEKLRPTKGIHLVFSRKKIPIERAVVMGVEKRIIFVIPRHEMVIVGTTDTDFKDDPANVSVTMDDVNYILKALDQYFPKLNVDYPDIISSYCGVRPLVDDGSSTEGKTSREHSIWSHNKNLSFVAGGKYTTYRKISEDAVDHILKKMPFELSMAFQPADTKRPLNPKISASLYDRARQRVRSWSKELRLDESLVGFLVERHGDEAVELMSLIARKYRTYPANQALWMAEADFAIDQTMCMTLTDFYWRRSPLFLAMRDHGQKYIDGIAEVFASKMSLSEAEVKRQKDELMAQMRKELSWRAGT